MTTHKMYGKRGEEHKCICGCTTFKLTERDKSYLYHCTNCGMFNGSRRIQDDNK